MWQAASTTSVATTNLNEIDKEKLAYELALQRLSSLTEKTRDAQGNPYALSLSLLKTLGSGKPTSLKELVLQNDQRMRTGALAANEETLAEIVRLNYLINRLGMTQEQFAKEGNQTHALDSTTDFAAVSIELRNLAKIIEGK